MNVPNPNDLSSVTEHQGYSFIPSQLILKSGETFSGLSPSWQHGHFFGEVVFNTGMIGYVESLTDPSYAGQLLTFTYPLIGNYGVPDSQYWESSKIQVAGLITAQLMNYYARSDAQSSLSEWCQQQRIPIISGIDTRALTQILRDQGVIAGAIVCAETTLPTSFPDINQQHLVKQVSIKQPMTQGEGEYLVIAIDCGMKQNILRHLLKLPVRVKSVPFDYDFTHEPYDGVFISNGPGDPSMCTETIEILRKVLAQQSKPIFGICLGAQLLALAINAKTYKLPFGHRAQNQPTMELASKRCFLTSDNHGYSIKEDTLPEDWRVSFRHLNDQTVQGIEHKRLPYFAVQFHPEAAPGPVDTNWLFKKFYQLLQNRS